MRAFLCSTLILLAGCPDDPPQPGAFPPQPVPTQTGPVPPPAPPPPTPTSEPLPPAVPGDAIPIDPAQAAAAGPAFQQLAARAMVGLRPDGSVFAAQFQQGQKLEHTFPIIPGRCYGVIGVGMGITELDLAIVLGEAPVEYTMGSDNMTGPQAVIGAGGKCVINTLPVPDEAKVIVTAKAGAGMAVAQIYSK